jgi:hypothetical protein
MGNAQGAEHEIKMSARKGWHALDPNTARCLLVDRQNNAGDDGAHCEPLLIAYESIDSAIIAIDANDHIVASGLSGPSLAIASAHIRRVRDRIMEMAESTLDDEESETLFRPTLTLGSSGEPVSINRGGKTAAAVASIREMMDGGKVQIGDRVRYVGSTWTIDGREGTIVGLLADTECSIVVAFDGDGFDTRKCYPTSLQRVAVPALPPGRTLTMEQATDPAKCMAALADAVCPPERVFVISDLPPPDRELPPVFTSHTLPCMTGLADAAVKPKPATCPDCKGTGEYVGLLFTREPCRTCGGK